MEPESSQLIIKSILIFILLLLSAFFSSAETAVSTCNRLKIKSLADEGNKRAVILLKILDNQNKFLSSVLVGNNIVNLTASAMITEVTIDIIGSKWIGVATGILTLVILIFGEVMPKTVANIHSDKISLMYASILLGIMKLFRPIVIVTDAITSLLLKIMGIRVMPKSLALTANELKTIISVSHEEGEIQADEKDIIDNLFDFKESYAKDVMVPKIDMVVVDINSTRDEILNIFREEQYTRYPIYEDSQDNIVGILNIKDLLMYNNNDKFDIRKILRKPFYTFEYKKTSELLMDMKETSSARTASVSIVLDEYGNAVGMITLEDLLEEIVGEIRDEYDAHENRLIQEINQNVYIIEGSMKLDDINEQLDLYDKNIPFESDEYDSIGGLLIELLERIPSEKDFVYNKYNIKIEAYKVDGNRIDKVKIDLSEVEKIGD